MWITGLAQPWDDAAVLAVLAALRVQPRHVWRNPANNDLCVEAAKAWHVNKTLAWLSTNDNQFCGARITRLRPGAAPSTTRPAAPSGAVAGTPPALVPVAEVREAAQPVDPEGATGAGDAGAQQLADATERAKAEADAAPRPISDDAAAAAAEEVVVHDRAAAEAAAFQQQGMAEATAKPEAVEAVAATAAADAGEAEEETADEPKSADIDDPVAAAAAAAAEAKAKAEAAKKRAEELKAAAAAKKAAKKPSTKKAK